MTTSLSAFAQACQNTEHAVRQLSTDICVESMFFSIIIPTYARPERLHECLQSLTMLDYPRDRFEVIVVDDGSEPPMQAVVDDYQQQLDITSISQPNAGPATARNMGARKAQGKHLVFIDDDCSLPPDFLKNLVVHVTEKSDSMVGGRTVNALPNNLYSTASQLLNDYLYGYFNTDPAKTTLFISNNLIVPAAQFNAMHGFDTSFPLAAGEDRELCYRWQQESRAMIYVPELLVYHAHAMTLRTFWRQHFNYGRGAFHYHQLRRTRGQERGTPEPLSFYLNLLCYPLTQERGPRGWLLVVLFFISQMANTLGFFIEAWKRK